MVRDGATLEEATRLKDAASLVGLGCECKRPARGRKERKVLQTGGGWRGCGSCHWGRGGGRHRHRSGHRCQAKEVKNCARARPPRACQTLSESALLPRTSTAATTTMHLTTDFNAGRGGGRLVDPMRACTFTALVRGKRQGAVGGWAGGGGGALGRLSAMGGWVCIPCVGRGRVCSTEGASLPPCCPHGDAPTVAIFAHGVIILVCVNVLPARVNDEVPMCALCAAMCLRMGGCRGLPVAHRLPTYMCIRAA